MGMASVIVAQLMELNMSCIRAPPMRKAGATICIRVVPGLCGPHHIEHEPVDIEVRLLLRAADDAALDGGAAALHLQAGAVDTRHLEAFQVPDAPRQHLPEGQAPLWP